MSPAVASLVTFVCAFLGTLLGIRLRAALPDHHLSEESRDAVKLAMGLVATMSALVLGLLIASTKGAYDTQRTELLQMAANIGLLDRLLAKYGTETEEAREFLREHIARAIEEVWSRKRTDSSALEPGHSAGRLLDLLDALVPRTEMQRVLRSEAAALVREIVKTRWLLFEQQGSSISLPFLALLIFWLTILFVSFGLYAPPNATIFVALFVCALSVAGATFLILEMEYPFSGVIRIPGEPLRRALAQLGH